MKKILSLLLAAVLVLSFGVVSVSAAPKLNTTNYTLTKGYQVTLKVTGNSGSVRWSSSDTAVATVSSGKVVGKKAGTAVISAVVDGYTLKTNLTVVDTKITASSSDITLKEGESATVTMTVTGTKTGITLSNGNSAIAKGTWGNAKWDGNKISFTVKGLKPGKTTITVYRKNYRSTYYKTINITVPGNVLTTPAGITASTRAASVGTGAYVPVTITYVYPSSITAVSSNTRVATVAAGATTADSTGKIFNITGISQGTATISFYDRNDTSKGVTVTVTVTAPTYYVITTTRPYTTISSDQVVTFQKSNVNYYMLVPGGYDEAVVNTAIAVYFRSFDYYTVYTEYPATKANGDTIKTFTGTSKNAKPGASTGYPSYIIAGATSSTRYMLLPKDYEAVAMQTAIAKYTGKYEYYQVYSERPVQADYTETIQSWDIITSTGKTVTRYILLPFGYDADRVARIKADDLAANQSNTYYVVMDTYPTNIGSGNEIFSWNNPTSGKVRYMIVPKTNCDFVARNDAIYKDTGKYCYFNAYSTRPTVANASLEEVQTLYISTGSFIRTVYILVDKTDTESASKITKAQGGDYYGVYQGQYKVPPTV
jgi:hypothetical protein